MSEEKSVVHLLTGFLKISTYDFSAFLHLARSLESTKTDEAQFLVLAHIWTKMDEI